MINFPNFLIYLLGFLITEKNETKYFDVNETALCTLADLAYLAKHCAKFEIEMSIITN